MLAPNSVGAVDWLGPYNASQFGGDLDNTVSKKQLLLTVITHTLGIAMLYPNTYNYNYNIQIRVKF